MKKYFLYISAILLFFFAGCSENATPEPVNDAEIVYVDERLKDDIGKTLNRIAEICEVRYFNSGDSAVIEEARKNPSSAVITRNLITEPEGFIAVRSCSLPSEVFVTLTGSLTGLFLAGGTAIGMKPDDAALALIEKVKSECSASAVKKLDKTFESICLEAVNGLQTHALVSVFTYKSQDEKLKQYCEQSFTFPASNELDVVMYVNESCPYKLVTKLDIQFISSGEFFDDSNFSIPFSWDAPETPIGNFNGEGYLSSLIPTDKKGIIGVFPSAN